MIKIRALTTGGSIDKIYCGKASDFIVGPPLLPQIQYQIQYEEICRKDSLLLTNLDRSKILQIIEKCQENLIIITHGTDTMWKTAAYIQQTCFDNKKTVVLCGAMQPAAFTHTDAIFNVAFALGSLLYLPHGAHVIMNGQIFSNPLRIYKDFDKNIFYVGDQDRNTNDD